jgi:hypothetical protein
MSTSLDKNFAFAGFVVLAIVALVAFMVYPRGGEARLDYDRSEMSGNTQVHGKVEVPARQPLTTRR